MLGAQIAVAVDQPPLLDATVEGGARVGEAATQTIGEGRVEVGREEVRHRARGTAQVGREDALEDVGAPLERDRRIPGRRRMHGRERAGDRLDVGADGRPGADAVVERRSLGEASHDDRVVEDLAVRGRSADADAPLRVAHDGQHAEVDLGREAAVEPDLLLAVEAPEFERAVVDEAPERDRLLDLVDPLAGQEHHRDVGLDDPDVGSGLRERRGNRQGGQEFVRIHGARILSGWSPPDPDRCASS